MAAQPGYMQGTANTRRRGDQVTTSQTRSRTSRSQSGSCTPNTVYSATSIRTADQYEAALEPHGIEIDDTGLSQNVRKHFCVDEQAVHIRDRIDSLDLERRGALRSVTIWLNPDDDDFIRTVQSEYKSMVGNSMNEAEFSLYALTDIFMNERRNPHFVYEEGNQCWLPERLVQPVNKPDGDKWRAPPAVARPSNYSWDIRPDCVYLLSLRAFRLGFRSKVREHVSVLQNRVVCPYLTLEFKKDSDKNMSRARHQVAIAACIALYNRWELKRSRIAEWTDDHRSQLGHYCLTFMSSTWDVWHVTPKTFTEWSGCRMRRVYSGNCTIRNDVVQLVNWINEIHYWGLTVHSPGCKDDIYARTCADGDADDADVSMLRIDG
ncbi:hypothetical protein SLS56_011964 [Neofusicoccum ribis]|uniref:Uncharacterized protein n=1 Tax=Neofusicoccum ribis TaxID=45134 RepID=A0ABR3SAG3_9PEZI